MNFFSEGSPKDRRGKGFKGSTASRYPKNPENKYYKVLNYDLKFKRHAGEYVLAANRRGLPEIHRRTVSFPFWRKKNHEYCHEIDRER